MHLPSSWSSARTLEDLDLYDNNLAHIKGLDELTELKVLDLSFNAIKHIKRLEHMTKLEALFFVQNKISKIEGLETLARVRNLELGGNRIRVRGSGWDEWESLAGRSIGGLMTSVGD